MRERESACSGLRKGDLREGVRSSRLYSIQSFTGDPGSRSGSDVIDGNETEVSLFDGREEIESRRDLSTVRGLVAQRGGHLHV